MRITADIDARVEEEVRREKRFAEEVLYRLNKDDEERRKWGQALYGIDSWDSRLYDVVLHVGQLSVNDIVVLLGGVAHKLCFQTTAETRARIENLYHAAGVECRLIEQFPRARVVSQDGDVHVTVAGPLEHREQIEHEIKGLTAGVDGIKALHVDIIPTIPLGLSF